MNKNILETYYTPLMLRILLGGFFIRNIGKW